MPAGSVELNESTDSAVLREIYEESGLSLNKHSHYIGCFEYLRKDTHQLHLRHVFVFESNDLPERWEHIVTGGVEDTNLTFDFYWLPISEAKEKLVLDLGCYLDRRYFILDKDLA